MYKGRFVPISVTPVGIDPDKFRDQLCERETVNKIVELEQHVAGRKVQKFTYSVIYAQ
jgi:trehalose-6-phosphate synthase